MTISDDDLVGSLRGHGLLDPHTSTGTGTGTGTSAIDAPGSRRRPGGCGITATGEVLSAETVRRMACSAGILPLVLDGRGHPLDLGRTRRLFSPAQRLLLWRRDRHCTYPGCSIPATWCDAHHPTWWSRGGTTDLTNAALLCRRHHTLVHERGLTATIDDTGVTWHLTPW